MNRFHQICKGHGLYEVVGDLELRSTKNLIKKFIEHQLPSLSNATEIPEGFETYWTAEPVAAFALRAESIQHHP